MNFRPGHVDLAINVPLLSSLAIRTIALGLGLGDRFGGFRAAQGPSLEEMVPHAKKAVNCRESAYQAPSRHRIAAGRSLHGKEGVDGSSPSRGLQEIACKWSNRVVRIGNGRHARALAGTI